MPVPAAAAAAHATAIARLQESVRQRLGRLFVRRGLLPRDDAKAMDQWAHGGGFSVDASVRIEAEDRGLMKNAQRLFVERTRAGGLGDNAAMGEIIASIALLPQPSVGRNFGLPSLQVPGNFDSPNARGCGRDFEYRMNREEFARVLERVRAVDPQLDANPDGYSVESTTMRGEVAGTADVGFNVQRFSVTIVRP